MRAKTLRAAIDLIDVESLRRQRGEPNAQSVESDRILKQSPVDN
jgi:hypothetical protein